MLDSGSDGTLTAGLLLLLVFCSQNIYWSVARDWRHLEIVVKRLPDIKGLAGNGEISPLVQVIAAMAVPSLG